ncbi:MAG: DUF3800 domain-containing protein [Candidatus Komeilibacteria bacterium]|nr:DUF3800 domain-containing protein [Candidatus Komeilibacteria bacterium]
MYIFIDESGIHKPVGQSTVVLVYVAVNDVDRLSDAIIQAEQALRIEPFHWNKQIWHVREAFLRVVCREKFTVKAAIIQNPFNETAFEQALHDLLTEKRIRNIIIDGQKSAKYLARLKNVLRHRGATVKKIRMGNDVAWPILRLADLYAGLIRSYCDQLDKKEIRILYSLAKNKIATLIKGGQTAG